MYRIISLWTRATRPDAGYAERLKPQYTDLQDGFDNEFDTAFDNDKFDNEERQR